MPNDDISASGSIPASPELESVRQPNGVVFEELTHQVTQLHRLLEDPHPGLITWCEAVAHRWHSISVLWLEPSEELRQHSQSMNVARSQGVSTVDRGKAKP